MRNFFFFFPSFDSRYFKKENTLGWYNIRTLFSIRKDRNVYIYNLIASFSTRDKIKQFSQLSTRNMVSIKKYATSFSLISRFLHRGKKIWGEEKSWWNFSRSWWEVEGWKSRGSVEKEIFSRGEGEGGQSFPRWKLIPLDNLRAWGRGAGVTRAKKDLSPFLAPFSAWKSWKRIEKFAEFMRFRVRERGQFQQEGGGEGLTWSSHFVDRERALWPEGGGREDTFPAISQPCGVSVHRRWCTLYSSYHACVPSIDEEDAQWNSMKIQWNLLTSSMDVGIIMNNKDPPITFKTI